MYVYVYIYIYMANLTLVHRAGTRAGWDLDPARWDQDPVRVGLGTWAGWDPDPGRAGRAVAKLHLALSKKAARTV